MNIELYIWVAVLKYLSLTKSWFRLIFSSMSQRLVRCVNWEWFQNYNIIETYEIRGSEESLMVGGFLTQLNIDSPKKCNRVLIFDEYWTLFGSCSFTIFVADQTLTWTTYE